MASRRLDFVQHYLEKNFETKANFTMDSLGDSRSTVFSAASERYKFRKEGKFITAVVRCDLNNFSGWCDEKTTSQRVELLDDFFSKTVGMLERMGGVYFRDEGDCILALFSDYFNLPEPILAARNFCRTVSAQKYGNDSLTSKSIVSIGPVVYYQKSFEKISGDWSADGDPFIFASRLEAEAQSSQVVHFFKEDFDQHYKGDLFDSKHWNTVEEKIRVAGIKAEGGWTRIVKDVYISEPKTTSQKTETSRDRLNNLITTESTPSMVRNKQDNRFA